MLYNDLFVITRKIVGTGGWWTKKTSSLPPLSLEVACCWGRVLGTMCTATAVDIVRSEGCRRGGLDRGDVRGCCKPNGGDLVWGITCCVCFAPPGSLFLVSWPIFVSVARGEL
jgi:hypothetical protein